MERIATRVCAAVDASRATYPALFEQAPMRRCRSRVIAALAWSIVATFATRGAGAQRAPHAAQRARTDGRALPSHEPPHLALISDRRFTALNESGWTDYRADNLSLVPDTTAPQPRPTVGQVLYPRGFAGGSEPVNLYVPLGDVRTLYVAFWFKMSPNFYGHPASSVNKIFHIWIGGANRVYLAAMASGNEAGFEPQVRLQRVPVQRRYNLEPNLMPGVSMVRGRWYKWEVVMRANTPGAPDGSVECWLDGAKVASHRGVQFVAAGEASTWTSLNWAPTWGGAGAIVPHDQWMRMSEIYISGR